MINYDSNFKKAPYWGLSEADNLELISTGCVLCAARICSAPFIRKSLTPALSLWEREQEESPLPHFGGEG